MVLVDENGVQLIGWSTSETRASAKTIFEFHKLGDARLCQTIRIW
jgi:hypothetical protein